MDSDDISERLDNLTRAVEKNTSNRWSWVWIVLAVWFIPEILSSVWYSKTRFTMFYDNVGYDQVTIEKKPHDCDFLESPLGSKECHYDANVSRVLVGTNKWGGQAVSYDNGKTWEHHAKNTNGDPIVSEDDGKTWVVDTNPQTAKPSVDVSWTKVESDR